MLVRVLVNWKRIEESFVLHHKLRVRGKDGISADEIHNCCAVEKEDWRKGCMCDGFDNIYNFILKDKSMDGKGVRG